MNLVIISPKAEESYFAILEYYFHYSADFAVKLDGTLEHLIENLRRFKKLCPPTVKIISHPSQMRPNRKHLYGLSNRR